jgi:DNA topoisomerase-6 subunit B
MALQNIKQKSAAEFFMEHQQIAGFDNPGKSLFTSIRELVENSLDAAESISVLPCVSLKVVEYTEEEHHALHGFTKKSERCTGDITLDSETPSVSRSAEKPSLKGKMQNSISNQRFYYEIICKDNGCGMAASNIGNLLGRVLSGSKHGIRQTRGKFGLGAKMVLPSYCIVFFFFFCMYGYMYIE